MRMHQTALQYPEKAGNPVRAAGACGLSSRAGSGTTSLTIVSCTSEDVYAHEPASLAAKSRKSASASELNPRTDSDRSLCANARSTTYDQSFTHPRTCMRMNQPVLRQKAGNPVRAASASGLNPRTDSRTGAFPQTQEALLTIVFCTSEDVYAHEPASPAKSRKSRSCSQTESAHGLQDRSLPANVRITTYDRLLHIRGRVCA